MDGLGFLIEGIAAIKWYHVVMWIIGFIMIFLAIKFKMEPTLLLPMGFGAILVNIPFSGALNTVEGDVITSFGILDVLKSAGLDTGEIFPLILFIGIGAMMDFGPLLSNPKLFFFGAAGQIGIFFTIVLAALCGFGLNEAITIGVIGTADGPTSITVANSLLSGTDSAYLISAITVCAYSYMALVPVIQPAVIKLTTTKKERMIKMEYNPKSVSKGTRIVFPIVVTLISGLIAPASVALVGCLMFGNLIRECGVLGSLADTASNVLSNLVTIFLGITVAAGMVGEDFLKLNTLIVLALGLFAFVFDTFGGIALAKFINLFTKKKINPMVGAAGISAFPMASRIVQKLGIKEDPSNHLLMHAAGANVAGQISSVIAGGILMAIAGI